MNRHLRSVETLGCGKMVEPVIVQWEYRVSGHSVLSTRMPPSRVVMALMIGLGMSRLAAKVLAFQTPLRLEIGVEMDDQTFPRILRCPRLASVMFQTGVSQSTLEDLVRCGCGTRRRVLGKLTELSGDWERREY